MLPSTLGREDELTSIGRLLDDATPGPRYLSAWGEAGIGKSMFADLRRRARQDTRVRNARLPGRAARRPR